MININMKRKHEKETSKFDEFITHPEKFLL